jgi:hypothetical protein
MLLERQELTGREVDQIIYRSVSSGRKPTGPARFQQRRSKGWRKPPAGRCISRPSQYGNPFVVPVEGHDDPFVQADAVARFRDWITSPEQVELLAKARRELRGLDLGCYCDLDLPCHADVLLELVNAE